MSLSRHRVQNHFHLYKKPKAQVKPRTLPDNSYLLKVRNILISMFTYWLNNISVSLSPNFSYAPMIQVHFFQDRFKCS